MKVPGLLFVALLWFGPRAYAQVRTSDVLATARKDIRVQQTDELIREAAALRFHLPLLRELEARLGIRGSVLGDTIYGYIRNEDIYGLQITANSLRVIKSQKAIKEAQINAYAAERKVVLEEALLTRYEALAEWYYSHREMDGLKTLIGLLSKKQELLRISAEKGLELRVKDVISTEEDRLIAAQDLMGAQQQGQVWHATIQQFLGVQEALRLDTSDFISIETISRFAKLAHTTQTAAPETTYRERAGDLADAKLRYHNAQNRQIFNSLRINYDDPLFLERPNKFNTFNNFSVRIALTLPLPGNNNYRRSNAILDWHVARFSAQRTAYNFDKQRALQHTQLKSLLDFYDNFRSLKEQSLIPGILAKPSLHASLTAMELVELEITQQQLDLLTLQTAKDVTLSYIRLLHLNGILGAEPYTNRLSERGEGW